MSIIMHVGCLHLWLLLLGASSAIAQPTWAETQQPSCIADSARFEGRLNNMERQLQQILSAVLNSEFLQS
jgi:hypothetical protein